MRTFTLLVLISTLINIHFLSSIVSATNKNTEQIGPYPARSLLSHAFGIPQDISDDIVSPYLDLITLYINPINRRYREVIGNQIKRRVSENSLTYTFTDYKKLLYLFQIQWNNPIWSGGDQELLDLIVNIVQKQTQELVNEQCRSSHICDLTNKYFVNNKLLKALEFFRKSIIIPKHVSWLRMDHNELESLMVMFEDGSRINILDLSSNNFKKLNYETFGKYIGPNVLLYQSLNIMNNPLNGIINMTELNANIRHLYIEGTYCAGVSDILPSLREIKMSFSRINHKSQLTFANENAKNLRALLVDNDKQQIDEWKEFFRMHYGEQIRIHVTQISFRAILEIE